MGLEIISHRLARDALPWPAPIMTCNNCYRVNPSGAVYCYNCGARLASVPVRAAWGTGQPDQGTGSAAPYGRLADGADARYGPARTPDMIYQADGTIAIGAPPRGRRRGLGRLLAPLAPLAYLLSKLKFLLVFAKFSKLGLTALTMLVSVVAYASLWGLGWVAAIGFVILLFIHEMGHWVVMRLKGVRASVPIFIPFLGAVIGMRSMPRSVKDEAEIGIAGPIAGTAGALACMGLGDLYGGHLWPLLGTIGLFLNLFNLIPVSPLDGGRVAAAISRWLWPVGLVGLLALFLWWQNPFLLLVILIGGLETIARFRGRYAPTARPGYYDISPLQRLAIGALYFGLIALIAVALFANPVLSNIA
jgi:Zn-dependent protease